jgi:hypothetical protein
MKGFQVTLIVVLLAAGAFLMLQRTSSRTSEIDPATLQPGPIRHAQLPDDLVARVRAFEPVFAEVYPCTHEKWVEGFQRDLNPGSEIAIWEQIAAAFTRFIAGRDLPLEIRKEAFRILLIRSSGTDETMLYSKLTHLTLDDARKLVSLYSAPPKPIRVEQR